MSALNTREQRPLRLLKPQEVADILGCDRSTAQYLMVTQAIKSRDIAVAGRRRQWRTTIAQIEAYVSSGEERPHRPVSRPSDGKVHTIASTTPQLSRSTYREHRRGRKEVARGGNHA